LHRPWQERLAREGVEPCAIELPGRLARIREAPFSSMEPLVATLAALLAPLPDRP
jgi:medium-chain acyl-[acyl-carrier-protein] hydrolase